VSATLEVRLAPTVPRLYFWALQASFVEAGRQGGAGHLGLQWHPQYPGSTAVNWGGYRSGGGELDGSRSLLAGTLGNVNTRDYAWAPGRRYRLAITPAPPELQPGGGLTAWRGSVTDLATGATTVVRELLAAGSRLGSPMVWSEVFARCDHPTVEVRWSDLEALTPDGRIVRPASVGINYQVHADGGCANTSTAVVDGVAVQRTNVDRHHAQGVHLPLR
jgi:hypothetical protein